MPRRARVPGRTAPDRGGSSRSATPVLAAIAAIALALVVTACGPTAEASPTPDRTPVGLGTGAPIDPSPSAGPTDASTDAPATAAPTDDATPAPPTPPATDAPSSSDPGAAAACSGSDENRDFFSAVADAVEWPVYCPVLPTGWFVDSGQYRLAGGGWLEIAYRGPGGTRIELHEGAFCDAADGCVPDGTDIGEAAFGDLAGTLVDAGGDTWAVVVDRGASPSWLLLGEGMDGAAARTIAADLARVGS